MEIEGLLIQILDPEGGTSQRTGNAWRKQGYVIETISGQYPRKIKFDVWGDRIDTMRLELNKTYAIAVDVESREFNGRWYTDLKAYSVREVGQGAPEGGGVPPQNPYTQTQPQFGQQQYPQAAPTNPYNTAAPAPDFSAGDAQEDLPF